MHVECVSVLCAHEQPACTVGTSVLMRACHLPLPRTAAPHPRGEGVGGQAPGRGRLREVSLPVSQVLINTCQGGPSRQGSCHLGQVAPPKDMQSLTILPFYM